MPAPRRSHTAREVLTDVVQRSNEHAMRLRAIEERYTSLHARVASLEQSLTQQRTAQEKAVSAVAARLAGLESQLAKTESTLNEIVDHLKKLATRTNLKELEQLVDLYSPLTSQFVTRDEVEQMMKEKLLTRKTNI